MSDIFLSFKEGDKDKAKIIAQALERMGYSVWWDRQIPIGKIYEDVIGPELDAAKCVVVLWSSKSVKSKWVRAEATSGKDRLVPVLIDNVKPPLGSGMIKTAKLIDWDGKSKNSEFDLLLESVKRIIDSKAKNELKASDHIFFDKEECDEDEYDKCYVNWNMARKKPECSYKLPAEIEPEPVFLGVSAPRAVKPGDVFTARFAAYIKALEEKVKEELTKLGQGRSEPHLGSEKYRWKLDTHVTVKLSGRHLKVDPSECEFIWKGESNLINFFVEVLPDAPKEWTVLRFEVIIADIRVAFIPLDMEITFNKLSDIQNVATVEPARTAFASYSSQDTDRVLDRVAAVKISAGLDVFMDCLSLHPGEKWKPRLEKEILSRDLFLLFWSVNARNSEWVKWELKTAMVKKGESSIQLHPLQTVKEAPPPEDLKDLHFQDVYMLVREAYGSKS